MGCENVIESSKDVKKQLVIVSMGVSKNVYTISVMFTCPIGYLILKGASDF